MGKESQLKRERRGWWVRNDSSEIRNTEYFPTEYLLASLNTISSSFEGEARQRIRQLHNGTPDVAFAVTCSKPRQFS